MINLVGIKLYQMKKLIYFLYFILFANAGNAQHTADNWYFGVLAGLHFSLNGPSVITSGALNTGEGCSTISDGAGNTLFYTDGVNVWNKSNLIMPNGDSLAGGPSSTQSALIVPLPGSNSLFYIFTVDQDGGANGFRYSIVDMTLMSTAGDVTLKNVPVLSNVTEKLTAVQKDNTTDCWIAIHEWGTDAFYIYEFTSAGLQPNPVISHTGMVHSNSIIQNTYGQMKFNPCGDKLALAGGYLNTVEVFDFDNSSGLVSNPFSIPMTDHVYGLEFSASGRFLYVTCYDPSETLVQFDLSAGSGPAIIASKVVLSQTTDLYGMQLAPDGKIYVTKSFNTFLSVINEPEISGTACNFVDNGIDMDPNFMGVTTALTLPGFVQSSLKGEAVCISTAVPEISADNSEYSVFPNPSNENFQLTPEAINRFSEMDILDLRGRVIRNYRLTNQSNDFTFGEDLSQGMYLLQLRSDESVVSIPLNKM